MKPDGCRANAVPTTFISPMKSHKNKYAHLAKDSHDEYHRWRSCERKRRYASPSGARLGRLDKLYKCHWCNGYHVASLRTNKVVRQGTPLPHTRRVIDRIDSKSGLVTEYRSRVELVSDGYKIPCIRDAARAEQKYAGCYWVIWKEVTKNNR